MRILVDGDSAGRRELIFQIAKDHDAEVHWVNNVSQNPPVAREGLKLTTYLSDRASQATDIVLMNMAAAGDIMITADLGLGMVAVSKGCAVLSPKGPWYREADIHQMLEFRHLRAEMKRRGEHMGGGPKPDRNMDEQRFDDELRHALKGAADDPS